MKKYILALLCLMGIAMPLMADNVISVSSASGKPGDEVEVTLSLQNTDDIVAAEIRIPLDKYVQYVNGSAIINSERSDGHALSASGGNNELRLYVYSTTNKALKGNSGTLATLRLKLGRNPEKLTLSPIVVLGAANGTSVESRAETGDVTILAPQLSVVSKTVDYGHVPIRSTYNKNLVLQNTGTAKLTVSDITFSATELSTADKSFVIEPGQTHYVDVAYAPIKHGAITATATIFSDAVNEERTASIVADPYSVNELHIGNAEGSSDTETTVDVTLNNMEPIVAAQWSFVLPDALKYVNGSVEVGEHANGLKATATVNGNKLTLFLYSTSNTPIPEGEGSIASFKLSLQGTSGTYYLTPSDVVLSNVAQENMVSATSNGRVVISSPRISGASSIDMDDCPVTDVASKTYTINNYGKTALTISRVTFLAEGFSIAEELPMVIPSNSSSSITVQYRGNREGSYSTTMQVYSNDPNERMKSVAINGRLYEPNTLIVNSQQLENGKDYGLTIAMDNYSSIVAFQVDIVCTEPFILDANEVVKTSRLVDLSASVFPVNETTWRVILYSMTNNLILGNEGDLLTLTLHPKDANTELLGATVSLNNIILSSASGANKNTSGVVSTELQVPPYIIGDANGDTGVNILDVLAILSIMKGDATGFNQAAADANEDSYINILDVLKILEIMKQ